MKTKVLFASPARIDVSEIAAYIAKDNIPAAENFYDTIQEKCDELARMPKMGKLRKELGSSVRSFPFGRYVIFYIARGELIVILRVLHGARDIPALF